MSFTRRYLFSALLAPLFWGALVHAAEFEVLDRFSVDGYAVLRGSADISGGGFTVGGSAFVVKSGNIGIGTTAPGYKLDAQGGDINASGSLREAGAALSGKYAYAGGANASGSWPVGITGNAGTATKLNSQGDYAAAAPGTTRGPAGLNMFQVYSNGYPSTFGNLIHLSGAGGGQVLIGWSGTDGANADNFIRSKRDNDAGAWSSWVKIMTDANFNSYAPALTGTGASGTWPITITGTASGAPPTGAAGGVLSGTYPGPGFAASQTAAITWSGAQTFSGGANFSGSGIWNASGNVGIGTTGPSEKLSVAGNISIDTGNTAGVIHRGTVSGSNGLQLSGNSNAAVNDTYPGASLLIGGGALTDTYEGNIDLTAYGGVQNSPNRNVIRFNRRTGVNAVSESMRVDGSGNVGIGTASPGTKLHIYAKNNEGILIGTPYYDSENTRKNSIDFLAWRDSWNGDLRYIGASITAQRVWTCCGGWPAAGYAGIAHTDLTFSTRDSSDAAVPPAERMRITNTGTVGIGTSAPGYTLHVNGSVAGTSAYVNTSDRRLKKDIRPITGALEKTMSLQGIMFNWDTARNPGLKADDRTHLGFIAQDIEKILPQVVSTAGDKMQTKSIAYGDVVPVLAEAIKEQQREIEALKARLAKVESR